MRALPAQKAVAAAEASTPAVSGFQLSLSPLAIWGLELGKEIMPPAGCRISG